LANTFLHKTLYFAGAVFTALALLTGCANRGQGPQGGPKDTTPPFVVKSTPKNGATGITDKIITLEFNEYVLLENPQQNITFSPPQKSMPAIKTINKSIRVMYEDSLRPNTTYTIEFGNAIVDNNEKNVLQDYTFAFSTGDKVDSLQISGVVLDSRTLQPQEGLTVGVYQNYTDTTFTTTPFDRITRTNKNGEFVVKNMAPGSYRLFALKDASNLYYYGSKGVPVAFYEGIITPELHLHARVDTLWKDASKQAYDSLVVNTFPEPYPRDLLLKTFEEPVMRRQLLKQPKRISDRQIQLTFSVKTDSLPNITLLHDSLSLTEWCHMERIQRKDSFVYWVTDSTLFKQDTIRIAVDYYKSDSLFQLTAARDTFALTYKKPTKSKKEKKAEKENENLLTFTHNMNKSLEVYDTLSLTFAEPIQRFYQDSIHLYTVENDSIETPVDFQMAFDDSICALKAYLLFYKDFEQKYQLRIDSAAFTSIYGKCTTKFNKPFTFKTLDKYANLYVKFAPIPPNAIVELLNSKEVVVAQSEIIDSEAYFEDITPGEYALRFFMDENQNKAWDTGNVAEGKQAETVYYYPKILNLRANWDVEEEWNYLVLPFTMQRPADYNVPKNKKK
jgi:hypothetical protein